MAEDGIVVEVFDGVTPAGGCGCSSGCGPENSCGPTVEESTAELERQLREIYGDTVTVKFVDTRKTGFRDYPLVERAVRIGYGFPIVSVNGQPRFAGGVDLEQICEVINEITEQE